MKFRKSRRLIQIIEEPKNPKSRTMVFIEVPGYLYHYELFGHDLFVHHKIRYNDLEGKFSTKDTWVVTEPRTGLIIDTRIETSTRKEAIKKATLKLASIKQTVYHEAILMGLAAMPKHIATWRIDSLNSPAVKVKN